MVTELSRTSYTEGTSRPAAPVEPDRSGPKDIEAPRGHGAAELLAPFLRLVVGTGVPVRFEFWDGTGIGPLDGIGTVRIRSVDAVRRILWAPGELGVARAFVAGDLTIEGDIYELLRVLHGAGGGRDLHQIGLRALPAMVGAAGRLGALGPPPPAPPEECKPAGRIHSQARDAAAISHHYDVGNDFYRLVLGPSMTYSCARFVATGTTLEEAQAAKHDLICRKLGIDVTPGARLLDVGCGWGSMAIHAALHHRARVVAVALSREQVDEARRRVTKAGLDGQVEVRLQDYRDLRGEQFDAISSIGMFEHVGTQRMTQYFEILHGLLTPTGRLLNHAISKPGGSVLARRSFIGRYVFPDGELLDVAEVIRAMQRSGFEVRDVESLREHYSRTLHQWVSNLEEQWDEAVALVGLPRANIWRLYMAASANGFDDGGLAIHQVLGVVPGPEGRSGMPPTRSGWG
jgi:cyclopropane-fatty-acyl-phospholipid synthase